MVTYMSLSFSIIWDTRAYGPRSLTRSTMAPCNTVPSYSVAWKWLCKALLTSNTHCPNENPSFWAVSPLKSLTLGVYLQMVRQHCKVIFAVVGIVKVQIRLYASSKMHVYPNPTFLLLDNSESPSIVEQLSQGPSFSYNTFISDSFLALWLILCLIPCY